MSVQYITSLVTHIEFVLSLPPRETCSKHLFREGKPEGLPPTNQLNHFKCCLGNVAAAGLLPITSTTASLAICVSATNQAAGTEPPCGSNGPTASTAIRAQARRRRPQLLSNHPTALGGIKWSQAPAATRMGSLPPPHTPAADCAPGSGCCCAHGDLQLCCRHRSKHHFQTSRCNACQPTQHAVCAVQRPPLSARCPSLGHAAGGDTAPARQASAGEGRPMPGSW
jgi:hypothetical protein